MDEYVIAATLGRDESEPFLIVKPLDCTCCHSSLLYRDSVGIVPLRMNRRASRGERVHLLRYMKSRTKNLFLRLAVSAFSWPCADPLLGRRFRHSIITGAGSVIIGRVGLSFLFFPTLFFLFLLLCKFSLSFCELMIGACQTGSFHRLFQNPHKRNSANTRPKPRSFVP